MSRTPRMQTRRLSALRELSEPDEKEKLRDSTPRAAASDESPETDDAALPIASLNETSGTTATRIVPTEDPLQRAALLFNDGELNRLHALTSDGKASEVMTSRSTAFSPPWYTPYPATLTLLLLLHVLFFYQWNTRKTKRQVLVTYRQLIHQKQYYRGVVAFLSHPPADTENGGRSRDAALTVEMGNEETQRAGNLRQAQDRLHPLVKGHLSGLPLLAYNAHILWTCRALEPLCQTSWHYGSMMLVLVLVSLALDLKVSANLLRSTRALVGVGMLANDTTATRRHALQRTMGTPTALTSALLLLYRTALPHISLPILPLLPFTFLLSPTFSYGVCLAILTVLSWPSHPLLSVFSGTTSAFFWTLGVTHFLATGYWASCLVLWIGVACAISLRGSESLHGWMPCIDYVAWDARGAIRSRDDAASTRLGSQHADEDDDEENGSDQDPERQPLTSGSDAAIHGRVPTMNMDDDAIELPRRTEAPLTRQRRGGGSSLLESDAQR